MRTAYIELNATDQISTLTKKQGKPTFTYKGIVFYPNTPVTSLPEILHENYRYFILDMGVLNTYTTTEFLRCDKPFLVCSLSKWRYSQILEKMENLFKNQQKQNCITLIMNLQEKGSNSLFFPELCETLSFPYISNPFQIEPRHFRALSLLIKNL